MREMKGIERNWHATTTLTLPILSEIIGASKVPTVRAIWPRAKIIPTCSSVAMNLPAKKTLKRGTMYPAPNPISPAVKTSLEITE